MMLVCTIAILCVLHTFIYNCMYSDVCMPDSSTVYISLLDTLCVCLCVDVDCMHYAVDQGEHGAINKTGLQCACWQNNLCDSMKKREKTKGRELNRQRECKIR